MSRMQSPLDRLGVELEAAAARQASALGQAAAPARRSRWWARHTLVALLVVGLGGTGAAVAATALLRHGQPVALRGGKPVAGKSNGAPTPGTLRFLTTSVADPDGGAPWAMRYWTTDRGYACFQVGRYDAGRVGLISGPGTERVFHPFQVGTSRDGVSGCYAADRAGHARIALHQSTTAGGATMTACSDVMTGDGHGHIVRGVAPPGCRRPSRTIDVGLLGPAARRLTVTADGKERTLTPIGPEGAYLVVQRFVRPVYKEMGFHHKDPKLNFVGIAESWMALTPAAHTIRQVAYDDGLCRVAATNDSDGRCIRHTAWVKQPPVVPGDVRAKVRAWAIDDKRIRVRFVARETVTDRRTGYRVSLLPDRRRQGFTTYDYDHDIQAGETARMTLSRDAYAAGGFTVRVSFRTAPDRPSLSQVPWQQGPLVGVRHVRIG